MSFEQGKIGLFFGSITIALVAIQPVQAAEIQITGVKIESAEKGFQLILETEGNNNKPRVLTVMQDKSLVAEVLNSQLALGENSSSSFRQENPIPGISLVELEQSGPETVRIKVTGTEKPPVGKVLQQEAKRLVLGFGTDSVPELAQRLNQAANANAQGNREMARSNPPSQVRPSLPIVPNSENGQTQEAAPQNPAANTPLPRISPEMFVQRSPRSDILVPNPEVSVEGGNPAPLAQPAQPLAPLPPPLPRAVAPPVGDIAVANFDTSPEIIDLGTGARTGRFVYQDSPVKDVLQMLARAADLNLIFTDAGAEGEGATAPSTITLDLDNEPVQNVFNYVLQVTGLEATRRGQTIFVGPRLPQSARNLVSRTFRLNQVEADLAAYFLAANGAEVQILEQLTEDIVNPETNERLGTRTLPAQIRGVTAQQQGDARGPLLLRGVTVTADDRLNTVTLVGETRKVQIAASLLTQLDARRRQAMINVKVVQVNLTNIGRFGTSFSFGVDDTGIINEAGIGIINFGSDRENINSRAQNGDDFSVSGAPEEFVDETTGRVILPSGGITPFRTGIAPNSVGNVISNPTTQLFPVLNAFLVQLSASIQNNNAKILTDPSLIVQEGQTSTVRLTNSVITNVLIERETSGSSTTTNTSFEKEDVGLQLGINIDRIDDNGFITMSVNPVVKSIAGTQNISAGGSTNEVSLVSERSLSSGTVRLRDGQTLILTGIIQDEDRVDVQKVPILGDLPIIGALFRRTSRTNERNEVIVMVTPQVMDDSGRSNFGYTYTPSREAQEVLRQELRPRE